MSHCEHEETKIQKVKRAFKDQFFQTETEVCLKCGAELWTDDTSKLFEHWVGKQDKIRVQFELSDIAGDCLKRLVEEVPSSKPRTIAKALILVFVSVVRSGKIDVLNKAYDSDRFLAFEGSNESTNFGFDVHPLLYLDISSLATIYNQKPNEMAWEAFHVMLSIFFSEDEVLRKYWDEEIFPRLQDFLKVG